MGNGRDKDGSGGATPRGGSIPTAETNVSGDELRTDPRLEYDEPLPPNLQITDVPTHPHNPVDLSEGDAEEPTVTGGERFDTRSLPVVSVPDEEARRLAQEGLAVVNPTPDHGEEATAAFDLPPSPPRRLDISDAPTSALRPPTFPPRAREVPEAEARTFAPEQDAPPPRPRRPDPDPAPALPGFVDASIVAAPPASEPYEGEPSEPRSLPGQPVHEAPDFEVDEDTFGPNEPMDPGTQLAFGVYRVEGLLGEGRMTRVYRATDNRSDAVVALAEFKEPGEALALPSLRNLLERYRQEEPPPAVLEHEGAIQLFDFFDDTTRGPVAVMEYVPAGDLESFLAHRGKPLAPREAAKLFVKVCDVLAHALDHGIVHGDIQPRNILLTEQAQPKLDLVMPMLLGAPFSDPRSDFAPPEVRAGRAAGPSADVYGLGASLYQASTDPRVAAEGGEAPKPLEPIIARCVEDDPGARYPTARELAQALRAAMDGAGRGGARRMSRLMQAGLALGAVAFGLVVGVMATTVMSSSEPSSASPVADVQAALLDDARALEEEGKLLEAAAAYRRLMDSNPSLEAPQRAYAALAEDPAYKKSLKKLRRRLLVDEVKDEARLREDVELLSVLAPGDALIDHWRSRLNRSNDRGAAGGPAE